MQRYQIEMYCSQLIVTFMLKSYIRFFFPAQGTLPRFCPTSAEAYVFNNYLGGTVEWPLTESRVHCFIYLWGDDLCGVV
jgi:hypothetical protein